MWRKRKYASIFRVYGDPGTPLKMTGSIETNSDEAIVVTPFCRRALQDAADPSK